MISFDFNSVGFELKLNEQNFFLYLLIFYKYLIVIAGRIKKKIETNKVFYLPLDTRILLSFCRLKNNVDSHEIC